jgi:ankyrin repeat protein
MKFFFSIINTLLITTSLLGMEQKAVCPLKYQALLKVAQLIKDEQLEETVYSLVPPELVKPLEELITLLKTPYTSLKQISVPSFIRKAYDRLPFLTQRYTDKALCLLINPPANINELLLKAVFNKDIDTAKALLGLGANPNFIGELKLFEAAIFSTLPPIVEKEATPLMIAAYEGSMPLTELLLDAGARPDDTGSHKVTPLIMAALQGFEKIVQKLLKAGAQVNHQAKSPLVLGEFTFDITNDTPLLAAVKGLGDMFIKSPQAEPTSIIGKFAAELLHADVKPHYYLNILRMLLKSGANPNLQDSAGNTPLHITASKGLGQAAKLLLTESPIPVDITL